MENCMNCSVNWTHLWITFSENEKRLK